MANHYFGTDNVVAGTAVTMAANDFLFIDEDVSVGSMGAGDTLAVDAAGNATCAILGTLFSVSGTAFLSDGGGNELTVDSGGHVWGAVAAISIDGSSNNIINHGAITGQDAAIAITGSSNSISNSGVISVGEGDTIVIEGAGTSITNGGTISSSDGLVISLDTTAGGTTNFISSSGTIAGQSAVSAVILGGDAICVLENTGHITGSIVFGESDDVYDGVLGTLDGVVNGGDGHDDLATGAGRDRINGGRGADQLEGGAGRDQFIYIGASDSANRVHDTIVDFDFRKDRFVLPSAVEDIDATVTTGLLRGGQNFGNDLEAAVGAGQLDIGNAVLFTPDAGSLAGHLFLVVDANGIAGYQKGNQDFVVDLADAENLNAMNLGDFTTL